MTNAEIPNDEQIRMTNVEFFLNVAYGCPTIFVLRHSFVTGYFVIRHFVFVVHV